MIDLVQLCLTIVANIVILGLIVAISYKKIVPYLLKKTLAGYMSGFARNQKAVKKEVIKILMDKSLIAPILDGLGLGNLKNYLVRHPDATMTVIQMIAPYIEQVLPHLGLNGMEEQKALPTIDFTGSDVKERLKSLLAKFGTEET